MVIGILFVVTHRLYIFLWIDPQGPTHPHSLRCFFVARFQVAPQPLKLRSVMRKTTFAEATANTSTFEAPLEAWLKVLIDADVAVDTARAALIVVFLLRSLIISPH